MNPGNSQRITTTDHFTTGLVAPSFSALLPKKAPRTNPLSDRLKPDFVQGSSDVEFSDFTDVPSIRSRDPLAASLEGASVEALENRQDSNTIEDRNSSLNRSDTKGAQSFYDKFGSTKQLFWKFHIERFDPGFYLSTNPTARHVKCRSSPGYFVRIYKDRPSTLKSQKNGNNSPVNSTSTLLVFEDTVTGEAVVVVECTGSTLKAEVLIGRAVHNGTLMREDNIKKELIAKKSGLIRRKPPKELLIDLPELNVDSATSKPWSVSNTALKIGDLSSGKGNEFLLEGFAYTYPIPASFWPTSTEPQSSAKSYRADIKHLTYFIGTIPQVRDRHFSLFDKEKPPKYVRKRHVYLHQEFLSPNRQFSDISLDLVAAVLRPCETRAKKRLIRKLHSISDGPIIDRLLWGDWDLDDLKYRAGPLESTKDTGTMSQVLDMKPYADIGDGLYFDRMPADDEPDHVHKHGWLTVYDQKMFSESGVFDLVVALTVAASYDAWKE